MQEKQKLGQASQTHCKEKSLNQGAFGKQSPDNEGIK